jgi:ribosome recycling factor
MQEPSHFSHLKEICFTPSKAIMVANIGFNPMNNGDLIIISVPPLTEERRRDLGKSKSRSRRRKVGIRNARKDAILKSKIRKRWNL